MQNTMNHCSYFVSIYLAGNVFQGQLDRERRKSDLKIVPTASAVGQEPQITDKRVQTQAKYLVRDLYFVQNHLMNDIKF